MKSSQIRAFFISLVLIPLIDSPWLIYQSYTGLESLVKVQGGRPIQMNIFAGIPVYLALAYLLIQQTTVYQALYAGLAVYAVYEFTNLSVFKDYSLGFAIADTLWGGILFALCFEALKAIEKYFD